MADVRINAGGQAYTDSSSNAWSADTGFTGSTSTANWGSQDVSGTSDPTLFRTEHYGGPSFQYALTIPNGTYTVNLYFAENYVDSSFPNGGVGYRVFSVQANGANIISNLDVFAQVGAHAALVRTATVTVSSGQLVLSSPQGWFVNAIEVIQQGGSVDTTPPTIPSNLGGSALSTSQIQLTWSASTDASTGMGGYHVFRNGAQVGTTNASTTTYTDSGLTAGTQYTYAVSAFDLASPANESAQSTGKVITTQSGTPATVIRINAGGQAYTDTQSHLWAADSSYSGNTGIADWGSQPIANATDPTLFHTERYGNDLQYTLSLPNGTYQVNLYFAENYVNSSFPNGGIGYRVFNVQANGNTIVSNLDLFAMAGAHVGVIKSATVTVSNGQLVLSSNTGWFVDAIEVIGQSSGASDTTPPAVPVNLTVAPQGTTAIQVSWGASTDVGTGVAGYHIYRDNNLVGSVSATTFTDTGLLPGAEYSYRVSAYDNAVPPNESARSTLAATRTGGGDLTPPTAPTGVVATALSASSISVTWSPSVDADSGVAAYVLYRNNSFLAVIPAGTTYFTDSGLSPATTYTYTVSAYDLAPARNTSARSAPASATTPAVNTPPSSGSTLYRINAGGPLYVDSASNTWSTDVNYGGNAQTTSWGNIAIAGTSDPTLYQTERYGPSLQYTFSVPNGTYLIHLYFAENYVNSTFPNGGIGYRLFSVLANGNTILSNEDVFAEAGAHNALVKSAVVTTNTGQIVLSSPEGWFVNAIDVAPQSTVTNITPPNMPTN